MDEHLGNTRHELARIERAREVLDRYDVAACRVALVLGSGLKDFAATLEDRFAVPYADVPEWPCTRVEGHGHELVLGTCEGLRVACLTGRSHLYEGWAPEEVVRPLRTLRLAGVETVLLTNAAGGIAAGWSAGDLMVIADHLNLTGKSPLTGPGLEEFGPRFPDQSAVWDPELRARLHAVDGALREGVYAGLLGPSYETPAEIRMLAAVGADVVGMSTVQEAIALSAMGARVAGVSLISNLAAGRSPTPLSHAEVMAAGAAAADRLGALLRGFCRSLAADPVDPR